jgi:ribonucleotide reductase class II
MELIALMMDLAMMGCGTGAVIEPKYYQKLPKILNKINVSIFGKPGEVDAENRQEHTTWINAGNEQFIMYVGDSRSAWVDAYKLLLEASSNSLYGGKINLSVCLSHVRPNGTPLKSFGGVANPVKLQDLFLRCSAILNKAVGRYLTSVECCLLIDEAASVVVAGNIRRSAGMRQFSSYDNEAASAKANLWQQTPDGWKMDPEKDALRMANHTRVFHQKPSLQDCLDSVSSQFWSGEGAIQWAGEAVARANADVVTPENKTEFLRAYERNTAAKWFGKYGINEIDAKERLQRYGLNPCVTADTWIHTEKGARQVKDLVGKQTSVYINGELFSTTREGFWLTGVKSVLKVITQEGYELRLTGNHQLLKVTAQTQKKQYS